MNVKSLQESVSQSREPGGQDKETEATLDKVASVLSHRNDQKERRSSDLLYELPIALKKVVSPGVTCAIKAMGGVGTLGVAGMEVAQISQGAV